MSIFLVNLMLFFILICSDLHVDHWKTWKYAIFSSNCSLLSAIILYYIRRTGKSNAFCHFYRKIQCVRKRLHKYILYVKFLGKSNVFCHNVLKKRSSTHDCQGQPAIQVPVPVPVSILRCRFLFHLL